MATTALDFKQKLFGDLKNTAGITDLLGPIAATNFRIYSGWPQQQPELTGSEPSEAWIIFYDLATTSPFGEIYQDATYQFNVYATKQTIGDQVAAKMRDLWQNAAEQDGQAITSDWLIVFAQEILSQDLYEESRHLYRKLINFQFRLVKQPYRVGA